MNRTSTKIAVCLIVIAGVAVIASLTGSAHADKGASMSRKAMKALYDENQRLAKELDELTKQLRDAKRDVTRAKEDLANYEYVEAENAKWIKANLVKDDAKAK